MMDCLQQTLYTFCKPTCHFSHLKLSVALFYCHAQSDKLSNHVLQLPLFSFHTCATEMIMFLELQQLFDQAEEKAAGSEGDKGQGLSSRSLPESRQRVAMEAKQRIS